MVVARPCRRPAVPVALPSSGPPTSPPGSRPPGRGGSRRPARPGGTPAGAASRTAAAVAGSTAAPIGVPTPFEEQSATTGIERRDQVDGHVPGPGGQVARLAKPRRILLLTGLLGAGAGGLLGGPVAAAAMAGYGVLGARAVLRRATVGRAAQDRRERLDQLCALAGELRVGLPVPAAAQVLTSPSPAGLSEDATTVDGQLTGAEHALPREAAPGRSEDRLGRLAGAAVRLAERTGAPLADLVERIEADARSTDRGLAAAAAQASGARATAWLLAALPLGGIGLGYGIGVDPLQVLLHTPVGGGCAIAAVGLQVIGLLWSERLATIPGGDS
ncbi:type II secretion system F family protein [Micromonospora sp. CP22]|uniref:type II secretion system F family protein n=1 Tax=Micromonospora sp. CP22 TaxID=2580517 RepID=UPI0035C9097D